MGIEPKDPGRCPGLNKDQSMKLLQECAGRGWKLRKHNRAMKGDDEPRVREGRGWSSGLRGKTHQAEGRGDLSDGEWLNPVSNSLVLH